MKITRLLKNTNLKVAILSLLLAILLWFFKAMSNEYSSVIALPIKVVQTGEYFQYGQPTKEVEVDVSGKGWNLFYHSLGISDDTISIPLVELSRTNVVKGREIQLLMRSKINGLKINSVQTELVKINYDQLAQKTVSLRLKNKYRRKYYFDTIPMLSTKSIQLTGPKRAIDTLAKSYTFGITDSMLATVSPIIFDVRKEYPEVIQMSEDVIKVNYSFKSSITNVVTVKVKYQNLPFLKSITAPSEYAKITYKVKVDDKKELSVSDFKVYADVAKEVDGFVPLQVEYNGKANVSITLISPRKIPTP